MLLETNLGPVVSLASAQRIRKQISNAGIHHPGDYCSGH